MRKFRFSLVFLSVLVITACAESNKKSSTGEVTNETTETANKSEKITKKSDGIAGKWKADLWHVEGTFDGGDFVADAVDMSSITVTFAKDGTFFSDGNEFTTKHTVHAEGMEFSNESVNKNPFNTGTWEKVGGILKMKNDGEPEVYEYQIDILTANRMEMSLDDYKLDDADMTGTFKAKMGFKR